MTLEQLLEKEQLLKDLKAIKNPDEYVKEFIAWIEGKPDEYEKFIAWVEKINGRKS